MRVNVYKCKITAGKHRLPIIMSAKHFIWYKREVNFPPNIMCIQYLLSCMFYSIIYASKKERERVRRRRVKSKTAHGQEYIIKERRVLNRYNVFRKVT